MVIDMTIPLRDWEPGLMEVGDPTCDHHYVTLEPDIVHIDGTGEVFYLVTYRCKFCGRQFQELMDFKHGYAHFGGRDEQDDA
jgi:hypothetical protein